MRKVITFLSVEQKINPENKNERTLTMGKIRKVVRKEIGKYQNSQSANMFSRT